MHLDLDPILSRQHGVVTRRQCLDADLSPTQIGGLLETGRLVPVFAGVYRDPAAPRTFDQRAMSAALAGGAGAVVSHRMAVALWGMRNFRCDLSEISAPRSVVRDGLVAHRPQRVEGTHVRSIPVTSPARSLIDCSTLVGRSTMGRFLETWLSTAVVAFDDLERELALSSRLQRARVHAALDARDITIGADSVTESQFGSVLVRHGLPQPVLHHLVVVSTGATFELDWSYPEVRVAFEVDGYGVHLRSLDAFEHDRVRRNELEIDGWTILNFTRRLIEMHPSTVASQARRLLATRLDLKKMS